MTSSASEFSGTPTGLSDLVALDRDHPGFRDAGYRARRNQIASVALSHTAGEPAPRIDYTADEKLVWATVWRRLRPVHQRFACQAYLQGLERLHLSAEELPQLAEVSTRLESLTGFRMQPVAGLVTSQRFLSQLASSVFLSTQYIRHGSRPLYTPEPDLIHEVLGHAASLCNPELAALNRLFGRVANLAPASRIDELERLYWYTSEFGVLLESGKPKAYGAGLLSSFGELGRFASDAFMRPFDPDVATALPYDPTDYQKTLFFVPDLPFLMVRLERYFADRFGTP